MLSFRKAWANHPTVKGEDALLDTKVYENQCAINLYAALERSGVKFRGFHGQLSWQKDKPKYAIRAQELADWLASPFSGMQRVEKYPGKEAFDKIKGNGILFFQNYHGPGNQGDHIDLWNGTRLTAWYSVLRIQMGIVIPGRWSDYRKAEVIWFWPVPEPV